jgi:methylated-DNA-[protein]-cysteine S-methyltransferase
LVIPCHRVVGSGGYLGGYSAPEGLAMKRRLLEREGVSVR